MVDDPAPTHEEIERRLAAAETRANRTLQALWAIRHVNHLIVTEDDPLRLIEQACTNLTETMGYQNAWIALLNQEGRAVVATAASGTNGDFTALRERLEAGERPRCMRQALDSGEIVILTDPQTECPDCPIPTKCGERVGVSRRLRHGGKVYGVLTASVPAAYAHDLEELALFNEIASDLAFALHKIEAAHALRESHAMLARTESIAHIGSWEWIVDEDQVRWSDELFRLFQRNPAQGAPSFAEQARLFVAEDMQRLQLAVKRCLTDGTPYELELRIIRTDGEIRHCVARGRAEHIAKGRVLRLAGSLQDITERKRIEENLRETSLRLLESVRAANVGLWDWDLATNKVRYSREWKEQLGCADHEISDAFEEWESRVYPDDLQPTLERIQRAVADVSWRYHVEFRMRHKDGAYRWILARGSVYRNADGQPVRVVGSHTDITESKRAQDKMLRHAERMKAVAEILQRPVVNLQAFLDHALDRALELTQSAIGYIYFYDEDRKEFILNTWSKDVMKECAVIDPQTCYELDKTGIWGEAVRQRSPIVLNDFQAHHPLKKGIPEGHVRLTRFLTVPVMQNDRIVAVVGVANKPSPYDEDDSLELTLLMDAVWKSVENMKSQEELRARERYLRTILQTSADGFWVVDSQRRLIEVNEAYCVMSGYARDELIGMTIGDIDADESPAETAARIKRIMTNGSELFETRHRRQDGSIWPVEVSAAYLEEQGGRIVSFCRDLTGRKQRESHIALLGQMLDAAPAAITIHNTDGRFLFANRATASLHGYDATEDFLALNLHAIDMPESEALIAERIRSIVENGEARFEVVHRRKDGSSFPLEVLAKFIDWDGQPAVLSIATDIAERNALQERRERQLTFSRALNVISEAIIESEDPGSILDISNRVIGEALQVDRILIYDVSFAENRITALCEWIRLDHPDIAPTKGQYASLEMFHSAFLHIRETRRLVASHADAVNPLFMENDSSRILHDQLKIKSLMWHPFAFDEHGYYLFTINRILQQQPWSQDEINFLESVSGQVSIALMKARMLENQKRAEEELRKNEAKHRTLVEGLPDIVMRFDRDGRHLFASDNSAEATGMPASLLIGKTHRELGYPDSLCAFLEQSIRLVFDSRKPFETEFTFESAKKQSIFNWRLVPELDADGRVESVLSISRDVTAHRRVEQDYRMLFREMLDGFAVHEILCDDQGRPIDYRFLAVNPAFERITGLKANDVVGRTVLEVLPGTEPYWIETYGNVALTGKPAHFENRSDEMDKYFEVTAFRPAPNQFACIFTDVTARKRAEEERQHLREQLAQAQKMESVGRLAGGVAHDFNNMLGIILGYAELAINHVVSDELLSDYLNQIFSAAKRSAEITQQLLAFARKQTIAPKVFDLNEAVEGMLKMLRRIIGEDIDLAWRPAAGPKPLLMDPSQLDQILANLCVNARDAISGVGKLTIETGVTVFDEAYCAEHVGFSPGEFILLAISDNGCGMDRQTLNKLFEPFFTTKGIGKGTGLGLATVYGIVKQNNGFINVYSEPGQGTTFKIYLPRYTGDASQAMSEDDVAIPSGRGETVLIVEDEVAILTLSKIMLERLGYRVLTATLPSEAMRLAQTHPDRIDLLATDVIMPEMNGRELARRLIEAHPHLKLLFMSGYTANVIAHQGVLDEGVNFIQKPFSMRDIAIKVRQVLDRRPT
ncbi:MAG TPA: PAS domain S-box protein [Candidatus Hydrogenedentes bacterium]|nr:PAS domain S-box protein [Candidatus Hydrogenedentota bacterium]